MTADDCQRMVVELEAAVARLSKASIEHTREYVRHQIQLTIYKAVLASKKKI